jgi:DNA (cytosine-5)-methyltransferase 1
MPTTVQEKARLLGISPTLFGEKLTRRPTAPAGGSVIRVADHFTGMGGSSTGASMAIAAAGDAIELVAINHNPMAVYAHEKNHPFATHFAESIHAVPPSISFPERHIHLLMSSPSCRPHSSASQGHIFTEEERSLCWSVIPWLIQNRTEVMVMENVKGFLRLGQNRDGSEFRAFLEAIRSLGYRVEHRLLNAADFGVPQDRLRLIVAARLGDGPICWPEPTHGPRGSGLPPHRTAREILDLDNIGEPVSRARLVDWTRARVEDGIRQLGGEPFLIPRRQGDNTFVRSIDRPLMTIMTDPGHRLVARDEKGVWRVRFLTVAEYLRAMSFPPDYVLPGDISKTRAEEMIGNAVPPLLMERLVAAILYGNARGVAAAA